jgi:hypothetical protein
MGRGGYYVFLYLLTPPYSPHRNIYIIYYIYYHKIYFIFSLYSFSSSCGANKDCSSLFIFFLPLGIFTKRLFLAFVLP